MGARSAARSDLFRRATDPTQYDRAHVRWDHEGLGDTPTRLHFHEHLRRLLPRLKGRSVIDIGSGTGHLWPLLVRLGAGSVVGVEPSRRNARISRRHYPRLKVHRASLERLRIADRFDLAVVVMAFEHVPDLRRALRKIAGLLAPGGRLYAVVGGFRYHASPRLDRTIARRTRRDGSVVVAVERGYGVLYDIVRPLALYRRSAVGSGLRLRRIVALPPSRRLMNRRPEFRVYRGKPISRLLVFERA